jgi:hypothetical protein
MSDEKKDAEEKGGGEKRGKLTVADLAGQLDARLRFLEVAFWNLDENTAPTGESLTLHEIGNAVAVMVADMRRDVLELYDAER